MTSIGGPGGIGGTGDSGGADRAEPAGDASAEPAANTGVADVAAATAPAVAASTIEALAAELAAGRLTPREGVRDLIERLVATGELDTVQRAELRELLTDLVTHDPYLGALVGRL
jgi:hypothetical protein